jgi:anthranilate synthase component 2/putative glutamine amidotransferase
MPKVKIFSSDLLVDRMFLQRGWQIATGLDDDVDLIQFTGGADVSPHYYGETKHAATSTNPARDEREFLYYHEYVGKIPMAGICRGGQLLNIANGGKMWQHVNNHNLWQGHASKCHVRNLEILTSSSHHQMMIPSSDAIVLLTANCSTLREGENTREQGPSIDTEAVYYASTRCLCYQPHPEYNTSEEDQDTYFYYLNHFLGV